MLVWHSESRYFNGGSTFFEILFYTKLGVAFEKKYIRIVTFSVQLGSDA